MRRRAVVVLSAAGLVVPGSVVHVWAGSPSEASPAPEARPGQVHTLALRTVSGAQAAGAARPVMEVPAERTRPFSLLGLSWDDVRTDLGGEVRVRVRSAVTGRWSPWRSVEAGEGDAPDAGPRSERPSRGATEPMWVGPSNGVQVHVTGEGGALPKGLRVDLVDPGDDPGAGAAGQVPVASTGTAPRPTIVSRAGWGADEALVRNPPAYAPSAKVVFTHHTAENKDYTCAQSPAVIRSIMLFHVQTRGWDDIGYNFLVDKCGTIFEGRGGGVDRPVVGAHTYGFNTGSSGVAVLGTYTKTEPANAAVSAVAKVAAWKLGLHGGDPTGKGRLTTPIDNGKYPADTTVTFNTISGHLDGFATECPGERLYAKLGTIRTQAKQWVTPAASPVVTSITGANKVGTTYYTKGTVTLGWKPAGVSRYEVLVDGKVVATPNGTATSARVTMAAGSHRLQVRAVNLNGTTVSSPVYPVVADTTAPVFTTPPRLTVRTGTAGAGSVPVRLGWKATDNTALQSVKATSPTAKTFTPATTSWNASAKPNTSMRWSLTAADATGNTRSSSVTHTAALVHESGSTRTGTWKRTNSGSYLGGKAYYSSAKGATARYTFTGRSFGLIFQRGTKRGAVHVYVDGVKAATVDTRASSTAYRRIVWTKSWNTSGRHTVKLVVVGTRGRPTVVTDGLVYIK
ncbi:Chitinase A, N-terminal domain [Thermomonospora echinospora]|uniref:Chitinase A, N-terminal domain n=1 Tax=Thermomonospora echinospora TaxID=1992 RepID=A0A1H6BES7_9ACTN|nr:N-acetylmuramoyl-L-alanine amidase [Thermomonospora echinospora]SEG59273.1 Chitinase A, N-terminal domain [Thermomonospora echinospora]